MTIRIQQNTITQHIIIVKKKDIMTISDSNSYQLSSERNVWVCLTMVYNVYPWNGTFNKDNDDWPMD